MKNYKLEDRSKHACFYQSVIIRAFPVFISISFKRKHPIRETFIRFSVSFHSPSARFSKDNHGEKVNGN